MVPDAPHAYEGPTGFDFVTEVPTTWDETRFLADEPGKYVVVERAIDVLRSPIGPTPRGGLGNGQSAQQIRQIPVFEMTTRTASCIQGSRLMWA